MRNRSGQSPSAFLRVALFALLLTTFSFLGQVRAATTDTISFQSKLTNTDGTNISNGTYNFRFRMYSVSSGGTSHWTEDRSLVVNAGVVSVDLGAVQSFPSDLFDYSDLYLQVCFDANGTDLDSSDANCGSGSHRYEEVFSTRKAITAVPVAFRAKYLTDGAGNAYGFNDFFIQGGNAFGAVGVIGTTDNYGLEFRTNNSVVGSFDTSGTFEMAGLAKIGAVAIDDAPSNTYGPALWGGTFNNGLTIKRDLVDLSMQVVTGSLTELNINPSATPIADSVGSLTLVYSNAANSENLSSLYGVYGETIHSSSGTADYLYGGHFSASRDTSTGGAVGTTYGISAYAADGDNIIAGSFVANRQLGATNVDTKGVSSFVSNQYAQSSGVDNTYGSYVSVSRQNATGGTVNTYGIYAELGGDNAGSGVHTTYGLYLENFGGGDTNYAIYTNGTTPSRFGGSITTEGILGIKETGTTPTYYTYFQGGDQAGDITYTLPTASSNGVLTNTGGVLSWAAGGGGISQVGSMTSSVVFGDVTADDDWLGLGASAGRIEFDDLTIDEINILGARVGIGTSTPTDALSLVVNETDNAIWGGGVSVFYDYAPATAGTGYPIGIINSVSVGVGNANGMSGLIGIQNEVSNDGSGDIDNLIGMITSAYNSGSNQVTSIMGASISAGASGGGATNLIGLNVSANDTIPGVTNLYGIYVGAFNDGIGDTQNRYTLYLAEDEDGSTAVNDFGLYSADPNVVNYFAGNVGIGTVSPTSFVLQVAGDIGPDADDTYDLGSSSLRFRDLYLGGNTLHIGSSLADEGTISYNTTTNVLGISTDSTTNGDIAFFTNQLFLDKSSGNVGIGTTAPLSTLNIADNTGPVTLTSTLLGDPGTTGALGRYAFRAETTEAPSWTTSYNTPESQVMAFAYDYENGVLYAAAGGGNGVIYRCVVSSGCDISGDWTEVYDAASLWDQPAIVFDAATNTIFSTSDGVVSRCDTSTGCDAPGDWANVFTSGDDDVLSLGVDTANSILYVGSAWNQGIIYRCDIAATGCDASGDFTTSFDTPDDGLTSMVYDAANGTMYAGSEWGGEIYRCDTATDCDTGTDWTVSGDLPGTGNLIHALAIDSTNNILYATSDDVIYRCPLSSGCDALADWSVSYDTNLAGVYSLGYDAVHERMFAGTGNTGIVYQCATSTGCDSSADWSVSYDSTQTAILSIGVVNGVVYAGSGNGGFIYRFDDNTSPTYANYAAIEAYAIDTVTGSEDGRLSIKTMLGGTEYESLRITGNASTFYTSLRLNTNLGIMEGTGSTYYTYFQGGDQSGDITYTLPTSSTNGVLTNTGGVLSWAAGGGGISQVGSMTSSTVFGDATADDNWLGLGASAGRIEFDDQTIDEINVLGARFGIGTSTPFATLSVKGSDDGATLGSEAITVTADRDFSSNTGNWSGTNWSISSGRANHTSGSNNYTYSILSVVPGTIYQITATVSTSTGGTIAPSIGGVSGQAVGSSTGVFATYVWVLTASSTASLSFVPNSSWVGYIDNISVKVITQAAPVFSLENSSGVVFLEVANGGATNLFLGKDSGVNNTSTYNTAVGTSSLESNVTGTHNSALGYNVLKNNSIGSYNVGIGSGVLESNLIGSFNAALGYRALGNNISGIENTAIGNNSMLNNISGSGNVGIGSKVLAYNSSGTNNVAIGYETLFSNLNGGSNNIGIGYRSGYSLSGLSSYNIAIGADALFSASAGIYSNIAIGRASLMQNSGNYNVALGENTLMALRSNPSGSITDIEDYDGIVTGTVKVTSTGHGLPPGTTSGMDITGTIYYDGTYNATYIDSDTFYINTPFASGDTIDTITDYSGTEAGTVLVTTTGNNVASGIDSVILSGTNYYDGTYSGYYVSNNSFYVYVTYTSDDSGGEFRAIEDIGTWSFSSMGELNLALGNEAGATLLAGQQNVFIGAYDAVYAADQATIVSNSIAIGYGAYTTASNQTVIGNSLTTQTLIRRGTLGISETGATPTKYTFFQGGDQSVDITYTLPTASTNGFLQNTGGVLSWAAGGGGISQVGSMTSSTVFGDATADDDWLGLGASAGRIEFDDLTIDEVNILDARVGIGTDTPSAALSISQDLAATNSMVELSRLTLNTTGTAANGLGAYMSTYIEDSAGTAVEAGRAGFLLKDATAGAATTGEFVIYTERGTFSDMVEVFSAYADGGTKWICGNSSRNWGQDCFGWSQGTGNTARFSFDGIDRFIWDLSGDVMSSQTPNGTDMKFTTLGSGNTISFDQGNNGTDIFVGTTGLVGINNTSPSALLDVKSLADASIGSELITAVADRDFSSSTGKWTGVNWSISGGVASHTAGTAAVFSLAPSGVSPSLVSGSYYQVKVTVNTTATGSLSVMLGGTIKATVGGTVGTVTESFVVDASGGLTPLAFGTDFTWAGSIDDVSIRLVTKSSGAFAITNSDGTTGGFEIRGGGLGYAQNTFVGWQTGQYTTGNLNVGMGVFAFSSNTLGTNNVAIGAYAMQNATEGDYNVGIGRFALRSNSTGDDNVGLGMNALFGNKNGIGNVAVGRDAGDNIVSGSYNTTVGWSAGDNITTGSSNIVIGNNIDAPSATLSNQLNIGAIIFGNGLDASGTSVSSGNVGIRVANPGRTLDVDGSWGGNVVISSSGATTSTITLSTKALMYDLTKSTGTTNTATTTTWNITGLPDTDGTFAYIKTRVSKGATTNARIETIIVQINGTQVSTVATASTTASANVHELYIITRTNGAWHLASGTSASLTADLAEWYQYVGDQPKEGELVAIDEETGHVKRGEFTSKAIIGVVSTAPFQTMGKQTSDSIRLALSGKVPVIVTNKGGVILAGDQISASEIDGVGMKSSGPGPVVGKALESSATWTDITCPVVPSVEDIVWPGDSGSNEEKPCFTLPSGEQVGKLMMFINLSYNTDSLKTVAAEPVEQTNSVEVPLVESLAVHGETEQGVEIEYGRVVGYSNIKQTTEGKIMYEIVPLSINNAPVLGIVKGLENSSVAFDAENNPYRVTTYGAAKAFVLEGDSNINVGQPLGIADGGFLSDESSGEFAKAMEPIDWQSVNEYVGGRKIKEITVFVYGNSSFGLVESTNSQEFWIRSDENVIQTPYKLKANSVNSITGVFDILKATMFSVNDLFTVDDSGAIFATAVSTPKIKGVVGGLSLEVNESESVLVTVGGTTAIEASIKGVKVNNLLVSEQQAGKAILVAGQTNINVSSSLVTNDSIVVVTPNIPVVTAVKTNNGYFVISIATASSQDIELAWYVVNVDR